jgi:uncharacterized protein YndB with AHSA1/START domain
MTLDGTVEQAADGDWIVAFDRVIDRPPEKIWSALTDPGRLANWLGDVEVDLRVGGKFIIHFRKMTVVMTGAIMALEPGRVIEYSWLENYGMPSSVVRWEIVPAPAGCRLRLTHRFAASCVLKEMTSFLGGWHAFLNAIPIAADGAFVPYQDEKGLEAGYRQRYLGSETRDEHATFMKFAGVQLERLLPGPLARVWDHLTKPELLPGWFGENSSVEPRVGGTVRLMNGHVRGTVTQWSPPHRLSYTWNVFAPGDGPDAISAYPESYLTITLEAHHEQVLLRLTHLPVLERFEKQNAMGWHTFIDILSDTLTQQPRRERKDYMVRNAARYGVDMNNLER